jgi:hypothetical protein
MSQQPARYERSSAGMIGAMVITVVVVLGFVGFRALNRDNEATPIPTVDYASWVKSGRDDHKIETLAPTKLPAGWRATSVSYTTGVSPHWHLGILTDTGEYVGIEEAKTSEQDLVQQYVDQNATRIGPVTIAVSSGWTGPAPKWTAWRDAGGDYGVVAQLGKGLSAESVLIVGSATPAEVRSFTASLTNGS